MRIAGILAATLMGVFFYGVRCRRPFLYGFLEFVVGVIVIVLTFYPPTNYLLIQESSWSEWLASKSIGVLAGIYVIVRGFDNMNRKLPKLVQPLWNCVFFGPGPPHSTPGPR